MLEFLLTTQQGKSHFKRCFSLSGRASLWATRARLSRCVLPSGRRMLVQTSRSSSGSTRQRSTPAPPLHTRYMSRGSHLNWLVSWDTTLTGHGVRGGSAPGKQGAVAGVSLLLSFVSVKTGRATPLCNQLRCAAGVPWAGPCRPCGFISSRDSESLPGLQEPGVPLTWSRCQLESRWREDLRGSFGSPWGSSAEWLVTLESQPLWSARLEEAQAGPEAKVLSPVPV